MRPITKKTILGIRLAVLVLAGYWLLIFVLTHLPASSLRMPKVNDKLMHFLAYGGLGTLMCYVTTSDRVCKRFGSIAAIGLAYAAMDEYTQGFVAGRHADPWDFVADAAGLGSAILIYATVRGVYYRLRPRPTVV
ncbi:MAG: VanZ family protein [Novipirellula sp. JB048]